MVFSPVDRERLIPEIVKRRSIRGYKPDAVPEEGAIVDLITLGYPDYEPSERSPLPVEDVVYWDRGNK